MESTLNIKLDMSGFKTVEKACEVLSRTVEVGILHNPEEARIGALQHNGGIGYFYYGPFEGEPVDVPPRPFLMVAMEHNGKHILETSAENMKDFTPESAKKTLDEVGEMSVTFVKDTIAHHSRELNSRAHHNGRKTVITKGFDLPLNDKGNMRESIEYEVVK